MTRKSKFKDYSQMKPAIVLVFLAIMFFAVLLQGWIVQMLWNWLAVSLFNQQPITLLMGIGIVAVLSFIGSFFKGK